MEIDAELTSLIIKRKQQVDRDRVDFSGKQRDCEDIIPPVKASLMLGEIEDLPASQQLFEYKEYSVCYAYKNQIENVVCEISRLRETVYRELDEGSGKGVDTDDFDETYVHLFVFDRKKMRIVGAYRFGQTDILTKRFGQSGLYLSQVFDFSERFKKRVYPGLEMGRSFVAPTYQNRPYSLFLLWRGIGAYLIRNPKYRTLYGTVSISNRYHPLTISMIDAVLAKGGAEVAPRVELKNVLGDKLKLFLHTHAIDFRALVQIVQFIEKEVLGVPVMLKHYHRVGARFLSTGIDKKFSDTPGLLLDVYMPEGPVQAFSGFFNKKEVEFYNNYTGGKGVE